MSRADRILNRKVWFETFGAWARNGKVRTRKAWQTWVLEWKHLKTHDAAKIEAYRVKWNELRAEHAKASIDPHADHLIAEHDRERAEQT